MSQAQTTQWQEACCGECVKQAACGIIENSLPACAEFVGGDES